MKQSTLALTGMLLTVLFLAGFAGADEVVVEPAQDAEVEVLEVVDLADTTDDTMAVEEVEEEEIVVAMETSAPRDVWWGNRSHSFGNYLRFERVAANSGICKYCDQNLVDCATGIQCQACEFICESCDDCPPTYFDKIFFDLDKAVLRPDGIAECEKAVAYLTMHPEKSVLIEGHTCDLATNTYNQNLGRQRAEAVRSYIVNQGIDPARVSVKSFGESHPWVGNPQRELNRRAIIIVLPN